MKRKMARLLAASVLCAQCSFGAAYGYAANAEAAGADAPIGGDLFVNRISAEDRQIIEAVTDNFMLLTKVPRPSGYMEKISPFLLNWAREQGFDLVQDEITGRMYQVVNGQRQGDVRHRQRQRADALPDEELVDHVVDGVDDLADNAGDGEFPDELADRRRGERRRAAGCVRGLHGKPSLVFD